MKGCACALALSRSCTERGMVRYVDALSCTELRDRTGKTRYPVLSSGMSVLPRQPEERHPALEVHQEQLREVTRWHAAGSIRVPYRAVSGSRSWSSFSPCPAFTVYISEPLAALPRVLAVRPISAGSPCVISNLARMTARAKAGNNSLSAYERYFATWRGRLRMREQCETQLQFRARRLSVPRP
ncbi:hypothetical protein NDU88_007993 [Pleurodeles waltl]|uniref:Uncharacterized protein n=1 Tax=Pleurodeles waltl TaxID=8319 RepID=A0AAV7RTG8_PLEWA|nr:hypothetical protein NDU88_007993 [Pleurodeles waltl]